MSPDPDEGLAGAGAGTGAGAGVGAGVGAGAGAAHSAALTAAGRRHVQSMSEVPWMGSLQEPLYFTAQSSFSSSAAATQTCPKLSQYVSQRAPLELCTLTRAVQVSPHVTPLSTCGHSLYGWQQSSPVAAAKAAPCMVLLA